MRPCHPRAAHRRGAPTPRAVDPLRRRRLRVRWRTWRPVRRAFWNLKWWAPSLAPRSRATSGSTIYGTTTKPLAAATPGVSTKDVMYRLGHASSRAALIYQHATEAAGGPHHPRRRPRLRSADALRPMLELDLRLGLGNGDRPW